MHYQPGEYSAVAQVWLHCICGKLLQFSYSNTASTTIFVIIMCFSYILACISNAVPLDWINAAWKSYNVRAEY